jgi:hypothetical protein
MNDGGFLFFGGMTCHLWLLLATFLKNKKWNHHR